MFLICDMFHVVIVDSIVCAQGIAPRLEFGSHAKVKEVKVPKHMRDALNNEFSVSLKYLESITKTSINNLHLVEYAFTK